MATCGSASSRRHRRNKQRRGMGRGGGVKTVYCTLPQAFLTPKKSAVPSHSGFTPKKVCCPQPQRFLPPRKSAVHSHSAFYHPESLLSPATAFFTP